MQVSLYAVPAPGQCLAGEEQFLGTVRRFMHKAPLTSLAAGLADRLAERGVGITIRIVDMQTLDAERIKYGELDFCGRKLEKYRVGTPFENLVETLREDDVVGLSANYTHSRRIVADFAHFARDTNPRATIVVGGTDATQDPRFYMEHGADVVLQGEAESSFEELLFRLDRGLSFGGLEDVAWWKADPGAVRPNWLRTPFDVETMNPPALDLVDLSACTDTGEGLPPWGLEGPFVSVETSRGCARACSFCATPSTKGRYRFMSPGSAGRHLQYFRDQGVRTLLFQEDNLLSRVHRQRNGEYLYPEGRQHLIEIFALARDMEFSWEFTNGLEFGQYIEQGEIDHELIEAMFWHEERPGGNIGCYRAQIPLENLSDESSTLFPKLKPINEAMDVIRAMAATGVHSLSFNLILGRPRDDEAIVRLSYDRCLEVQDAVAQTSNTETYFNVYNLSLFPGTPDYRNLAHLLAFDLDEDPEVITFYLACMQTDRFSPLDWTEARGTLAAKLNDQRQIREFDETRYLTSRRWDRLLAD